MLVKSRFLISSIAFIMIISGALVITVVPMSEFIVDTEPPTISSVELITTSGTISLSSDVNTPTPIERSKDFTVKVVIIDENSGVNASKVDLSLSSTEGTSKIILSGSLAGTWKTSSKENVLYTFTVIAADNSGNTAQTAFYTITSVTPTQSTPTPAPNPISVLSEIKFTTMLGATIILFGSIMLGISLMSGKKRK